jgi:hypothetical protein
MEGVFTNYRINKDIDRTGINLLMKNIKRKTKITSIIVFSAINSSGEQVTENWILKKQKNGKYKFVSCNEKSDFLKLSKNFRTSILNYLTTSSSVVVILICNMNQKIDTKKTIKEMWGFRIDNVKKNTTFTVINSEDIYNYSTTNIYTGKSIPPKKELVYCGPDGKICGWDMI